jgi:hypothetical protein
MLVERREHRFFRATGERAGTGSGSGKATALGFTGDDPHGRWYSFQDSASLEPFCIVAEQSLDLFCKLRMATEVGVVLHQGECLASRGDEGIDITKQIGKPQVGHSRLTSAEHRPLAANAHVFFCKPEPVGGRHHRRNPLLPVARLRFGDE